MSDQQEQIKSVFKFNRVLIPVAIGFVVTILIFYREFKQGDLLHIKWSSYWYLWIFAAVFLMGIRVLTYMYRIRLLTDRELSWKRSLIVILLWEFASAVTPSIIGGTAVAFYIVHKEGIKMGRTTAIVSVTAMLDELFYLLVVPFILIFVWGQDLFPAGAQTRILGLSFGAREIFMIGYFILMSITLLIIYGIFVNPKGFKKLLFKFTSFKIFKRFRHKIVEAGNDIVITSSEMKGKKIVYWIKAFSATVISWTARFLVINFIIMAVTKVDDHILIYARQLVMWVIMLVSPTPGGSGIAEIGFMAFMKDFIPAGTNVSVLALLWRLLSYYPFLFLGLLIIPSWLKRVYRKKNQNLPASSGSATAKTSATKTSKSPKASSS